MPDDSSIPSATPPEQPRLQTVERDRILSTLHAEEWPDQIGPYRMIKVLGRGGMGAVLLAEQVEPIRRQVAIKLIKLGMDSAEVVARFQAERQTLARLDHPHIAKVLEAGVSESGRPYFVMEYVPGEPICAFADRQRLDLRQRLELLLQVCDAIGHAHTKAILHRDIKPSNVLAYTQDGRAVAKVIDFGIAKALEGERLSESSLHTEAGQLVGTYEYMSPEQADGSADIDTRSDVYSLGVLLYELMCGSIPFERTSPGRASDEALRKAIRDSAPPRPCARVAQTQQSQQLADARHTSVPRLVRDLRRELEWIPLKAIRKEPHRRYESARQLGDDVMNYLAGRALLAGPESTLYRARKAARRHRGALLAGGLIALAIIVGAAVSAVGFVRASRNATAYRREFQRAEDESQRLGQVNTFITAMLAHADPQSGAQKDLTVRELIDRTVTELDGGALREQPRVEAALRAVLGRAYLGLSQWQPAESQWKAALELESRLMGADSPEAAVALTWLGQVQLRQGRLAEARRSLEKALALQRAKLPGDPQLADALGTLAEVEEQSGRPKQAMQLYRESVDLLQPHRVEQGPRLADAMSNLAAALNRAGDNAAAATLAQQALELRRGLFGPRSVDVLNSLFSLANIQEAASDYAGALQTRRECLEIAQERFDERHRMVAVHLMSLARLQWLMGQGLDEAQSLQERAIRILEAINGPRSAPVAQAINIQACILRDRGDLDAAMALLNRELEIRAEIQPTDHPDVSTTLLQLADTMTRAGRGPDAIDAARRALEIRTKVYPANHWAVWNSTSVLGGALAASGDFEQAERLLLSAYEGLRGGSALGRRAEADAAERLVTLYEKWSKPDQAAQWRKRAAEAKHGQ